ncbi:MAG: hypothetical protein Q7J79_08445 [Gemmatimonadales bacterium]|nr:hypothetical protein [Gemmatimonadales bacterium]
MLRALVQTSLVISAAAFAVGCYDDLVSVYVPASPTGLAYELEPSGDPLRPRGVILRWTPTTDGNVESYNVHSRASQSESFGLRGTTTSPSFHDDGLPHLEYYVTAVSVDGGESDPSIAVLVDERLRLPAPASVTSISLNAAIHVQWSDNAFTSDPDGFSHYRLYSANYDLDQNLCAANWTLEGTTVSASFLSANLTNGRPRCFGVSAVTIEGFESLWSPLRNDTPRPDGRNVLLFASGGNLIASAFRFYVDANGNGLAEPGELGRTGSRTDLTNDFYLTLDPSGAIFIVPLRTGTQITIYGNAPIADLTSIDIAPAVGYTRNAVQASPMYGYVFQMTAGDPFARYGAIRVTAVGTDYVIFDWSYQTDPGNPELVRHTGGSGR